LPWLICEIDHEIAGYAYAVDHRNQSAYQWSKEMSVYIDENFRRKRIASALYTSIIDILKAQGVMNALAGITLPNSESVSFHENFGFRLVGIYHRVGYKLNRFHDTGWYEYVITKNDRPPSNIIPVNEIRNSEKWLEAVHHGLSLIG
jgi:phosphinothricin acetyltransferase